MDSNASINNNSLENNPQSKEEEEEAEEQRRRQQELDCLLSDGIQAFTFDDDESPNHTFMSSESCSSLNKQVSTAATTPPASTISTISHPELSILKENYKQVTMPEDQIKILYEVRVREVHNLNEQLNILKKTSGEEMKLLKNKLLLSEAEIRQLKLSLTNMESLLVEKIENLREMEENLKEKEMRIEKFEKQINENQVEISSFKTAMNDLHLKQQTTECNALSRNFQSGEMQRAHQEQITRLEMLLEQQINENKILNKENLELKENFKKFLKTKSETDKENSSIITELSERLQTSQQQCKDLFSLGEALKKECDHFKERIQQFESNESFFLNEEILSEKSLDNETLLKHVEKLKRMLLDKNTELNTFKEKLKFYETDMIEFFEYQKIINRNSEFQNCNNKMHKQQFLYFESEINNLKNTLDERNKQIVDLNLVNKELQEKIEEMLQQTRVDLKNLSDKYNMPQLDKMTKELKEAERKIDSLQEHLENVLKNNGENNLENELTIAKAEIENLLKNQMKLEEDKNELEERLKLNKKELDLTKKHLEMERKYEKEYNDFDKVIKRFENEIKTYKESLKYMEESKNKLNNQVKESQIEINELKLKINLLESKNHDINDDNDEIILNAEIKLREQLRDEHQMNLEKIEETYKKAIIEKKKEIEKLKEQELKHRTQLAMVIEQCAIKISYLENEIEKLKSMNVQEHEEYKKACKLIEDKYKTYTMEQLKQNYQEIEKKFEELTNQLKQNQTLNRNKMKSILLKMDANQFKYDAIQKHYQEKIDKFSSSSI